MSMVWYGCPILGLCGVDANRSSASCSLQLYVALEADVIVLQCLYGFRESTPFNGPIIVVWSRLGLGLEVLT